MQYFLNILIKYFNLVCIILWKCLRIVFCNIIPSIRLVLLSIDDCVKRLNVFLKGTLSEECDAAQEGVSIRLIGRFENILLHCY